MRVGIREVFSGPLAPLKSPGNGSTVTSKRLVDKNDVEDNFYKPFCLTHSVSVIWYSHS